MMFGIITSLDLQILDWIQAHLRNDVFDIVFTLITHLGDGGLFWIALALILICTKKYRRAGICMGIALICGVLVGNLTLKPLIGRIRPFDLRPTDLLISPPSDFSFPSGHTLASFGGATALYRNHPKGGVPALVLAVLIAFSRLYLYVHYPTDILAGLVLGICFGLLSPAILRKAEVLVQRIQKKTEL